MSEIVLPLGQPAGYNVPLDENGDPTMVLIRVGDDYHEITMDDYGTWLGVLLHHDRAAVERIGIESGHPETPESYQRLLDGGLIVTFTPDTDLKAALSDLCIIPMGFGAGPSKGSEGRSQILGSGLDVRASVDPDVFSIWVQGPHHSIWSGVELAADQPDEDVRDLARQFLESLAVIMAAGCAVLDRRP